VTHDFAVHERHERFSGNVITVISDKVAMPGGSTALLIRQYRHPVRTTLWETPAGLLDVPGEPPLDAARRELYEEGGLRAATWHVLADIYTSPGMSDEAVRMYLARDVEPVSAADRYVGQDEEAELELHWIDLAEARRMALSGEIQNGPCLVGVLAAAAARDTGWTQLRPADATWPAHTDHA
jgi:ADP-ribose pyrophosphatase